MAEPSHPSVPTLILSSRYTEDAQCLWHAAIQRGWRVERIHGWRIPDQLRRVQEPILYLETLMAPPLAEAFGLTLLEPPDDWLPRLPVAYRQRRVQPGQAGATATAPPSATCRRHGGSVMG